MTDIFISYSHIDEKWKDVLQKHLSVLQTHGEFSVWDDRQIKPGDPWLPAIEGAISEARVAILLVSSDFLTSGFVAQQEIPKFLERSKEQGLKILPVMLRHCVWQTVPWLSSLQGATKDNVPLSDLEWDSSQLERALSEITLKVYHLLQESREAERQEQEAARLAEAPVAEQVRREQPAVNTPKTVERQYKTQAEQAINAKPGRKFSKLLGILGLGLMVSVAVVYSAQDRLGEWFASPVTATIAGEPEMVFIRGGEFQMGCASGVSCHSNGLPVHKVTVPDFEIGRYEVTFAEWDACVADGGCGNYKPADQQWGRENRPVINVSWDNAQQYIVWLKQTTGKQYRLPTEAEWEYAARAGTVTAYPWGEDIGENRANCDGCGSQWDNQQTAPVGSFNPYGGVYDMNGNVWEWVQDCYHSNYKGTPVDGSVWEKKDCPDRVLRGGSWVNKPESLRSANRYRDGPTERDDGIGFRVARTL